MTSESHISSGKCFGLVVMGMVVMCGAVVTPCAAQTLERTLRDVASVASKDIKAEGSETTIQVIGPTAYSSSGPARVKEILGSELQKTGISIKRFKAKVGLKCELTVKEEVGISELTVLVRINLMDSNETVIKELTPDPIQVTDPVEIASILSPPVDMTAPSGPTDKGNDPIGVAVKGGFENPKQVVRQGSIALAAQGGSFAMELLVNGSAKPIPISVEDGLAFAELKDSDEVDVRLINDADYEVAARLRMDGVDSTHYNASPLLWIIKAHSSMTVPGWYCGGNKDNFKKFTIAAFEKSVAFEAGSIGDVGVINAEFWRSYRLDEEIPDDDKTDAQFPTYSPPLGVGVGAALYKTVELLDRAFGRLKANVAIRYGKPKP